MFLPGACLRLQSSIYAYLCLLHSWGHRHATRLSWLRWSLSSFLLKLALNCYPPVLYLKSSQNYSYKLPCLAWCHSLGLLRLSWTVGYKGLEYGKYWGLCFCGTDWCTSVVCWYSWSVYPLLQLRCMLDFVIERAFHFLNTEIYLLY
jgi:hypothetical protein